MNWWTWEYLRSIQEFLVGSCRTLDLDLTWLHAHTTYTHIFIHTKAWMGWKGSLQNEPNNTTTQKQTCRCWKGNSSLILVSAYWEWCLLHNAVHLSCKPRPHHTWIIYCYTSQALAMLSISTTLRRRKDWACSWLEHRMLALPPPHCCASVLQS